MIPSIAHFVWLNSEFPWLNVLAVQSASRRGNFERLVLHHSCELETAALAQLREVPRLELRALRPQQVLASLAPELGEAAVRALSVRYSRLSSPAARSNILRAALLVGEGGVYLDLDTVTVRDLRPLRESAGVFCGTERVAFPGCVPGRSTTQLRARGLALAAVRAALSRAPSGWRTFRRIEHRYPAAANNAVLGAEPSHPFLLGLLERMIALPQAAAMRRYALGTHLLQAAVQDCRAGEVRVLPPEVFYPLGPVMSQHWFAKTRDADVQSVLSPETRVVHFYASLLSTAQQRAIGPESIRREQKRQLFSALVRAFGLVH